MSDRPIGLIGVGLLGSALAERMTQAGLPMVGFDTDDAQLQRLRQLGCTAAANARDVAANCLRIVFCLPDSEVVKAVVREIEGELLAGAVLIDATTGDPDDAVKLAQELATRNVAY